MRKIEQILLEINMSTYRLAQLIEVSPQTARNIVQKKQFGKEYLLLQKICVALDCDVTELLTDEELTELKKL